MYNFDYEALPHLFPVSEGAQLRPWFTLSTIDRGLQLIGEQRVTAFHSVRSSVGALIDNKAVAALRFEKSTKLRQGFILRDRRCDICRLKPDNDYCEHLAAVAILGLTVTATPESRVIPTAFALTESNWSKLGSFLSRWLGKSEAKLDYTAGMVGDIWAFTPGEGAVKVVIPKLFLPRGMLFFPAVFDNSAREGRAEKVALLDNHLRDWAMTSGEKALEKTGNRSIGWRKDTSFWAWLTGILFMIHGEDLPELFWDTAAHRFYLKLGVEGELGALEIHLPKKKTWELVRDVPVPSAVAETLPTAKECYRVSYKNDSSLVVEPCLYLEDGRVLQRQELAASRFGDVYFLEGEGFLPTKRLPAEGVFSLSLIHI